MAGYYISINVWTKSIAETPASREGDLDCVKNAVIEVFAENAMPLLQEDPAASVVDNEDKLPDGEDWYGAIISGLSVGWVTVYVDDWKDSGVLARSIAAKLGVEVLEIWIAEDTHWGYTYFSGDTILDRYADDPACVIEEPGEAPLYRGSPEALSSIGAPEAIEAALESGRQRAGTFVGPALAPFCDSVGVSFERVLTTYEQFFMDDPEEYSSDHPDWVAFRHLSFLLPEGREGLSD